ncbi:MAG: site-2 protease family protein [Proteobacteria bacterium]|jgi:stage IV sporulation protein FB|nr:site-2 protease family protein [Pseudomonadota bacterium]
MRWSLKIGSLFGIPIRLHFSMAIVPLFAFSTVESGDFAGIALALGLTVLLFGSVVAHELGHALVARRFGVRTEDIVLLPIGGVARIVNLPKRPVHEIAIAAAGPAVSIALATAAYVLLLVPSLFMSPVAVAAASVFIKMNVILGLFNLVPALPMDGGRVLRGLLALKRDYLSATRIAVRIGRGLAIAGMVYAIWAGDLMLGFIALFVFMGAGSEERIAWMREAAERGAAGRGPMGGVVVIQGGKAEVISRKDPED